MWRKEENNESQKDVGVSFDVELFLVRLRGGGKPWMWSFEVKRRGQVCTLEGLLRDTSCQQ